MFRFRKDDALFAAWIAAFSVAVYKVFQVGRSSGKYEEKYGERSEPRWFCRFF